MTVQLVWQMLFFSCFCSTRVRNIGDTSQSARSDWLLQVSAQYSIAVLLTRRFKFTIQIWGSLNLPGALRLRLYLGTCVSGGCVLEYRNVLGQES